MFVTEILAGMSALVLTFVLACTREPSARVHCALYPHGLPLGALRGPLVGAQCAHSLLSVLFTDTLSTRSAAMLQISARSSTMAVAEDAAMEAAMAAELAGLEAEEQRSMRDAGEAGLLAAAAASRASTSSARRAPGR